MPAFKRKWTATMKAEQPPKQSSKQAPKQAPPRNPTPPSHNNPTPLFCPPHSAPVPVPIQLQPYTWNAVIMFNGKNLWTICGMNTNFSFDTFQDEALQKASEKAMMQITRVTLTCSETILSHWNPEMKHVMIINNYEEWIKIEDMLQVWQIKKHKQINVT